MKTSVCLFAVIVAASAFADSATNQLPTIADNAAEAAREKFRQLEFSLNNGEPAVTNKSYINKAINSWIACVSNINQRTELAHELAEAILSVNLTNQPYLVVRPDGRCHHQRGNALILYQEYIYYACWIMNENGCSPRSVMEFFFKALKKYKEACFSIPLALQQLPGESKDVCTARCSCAGAGYRFYAQFLKDIRMLMETRNRKYLCLPNLRSPELEEEFTLRLKIFYKYPTEEEFKELQLHPDAHLKPPKLKDDPEVEVTVEFPGEETNGGSLK